MKPKRSRRGEWDVFDAVVLVAMLFVLSMISGTLRRATKSLDRIEAAITRLEEKP